MLPRSRPPLESQSQSQGPLAQFQANQLTGQSITTIMDKMCASQTRSWSVGVPRGLIRTRLQQNPDDVVITLAIRSPMCKGHKGGFRETQLDALVYRMLCAVIQRSSIDPALVEDICLGNVRGNCIFTQPRRKLRGDRSAKAKQAGTAGQQRWRRAFPTPPPHPQPPDSVHLD